MKSVVSAASPGTRSATESRTVRSARSTPARTGLGNLSTRAFARRIPCRLRDRTPTWTREATSAARARSPPRFSLYLTRPSSPEPWTHGDLGTWSPQTVRAVPRHDPHTSARPASPLTGIATAAVIGATAAPSVPQAVPLPGNGSRGGSQIAAR